MPTSNTSSTDENKLTSRYLKKKSTEKIKQSLPQLSESLQDKQKHGRVMWLFLEMLAILYQPEKKEAYKIFFELLPLLHPCPDCGSHLEFYYKISPPNLSSPENLVEWVYTFHEFSNYMTKKA
jgi:hypothetical protein